MGSGSHKRKASEFLALAAKKLEEFRRDDASFCGLRFDDTIALVRHSWRFRDSVPEQIAESLCRKAVFLAAKSKPISPESLKKALARVAEEYEKRAIEEYVILTSISLTPGMMPEGMRVSVGNTELIFKSSIDPAFDQEAIYSKFKRLNLSRVPDHYSPVMVRVQARCLVSAIENGLWGLDAYRGAINFVINRAILNETGPEEDEPVNRVLLGPVHTVHRPNGALVSEDSFWRESCFRAVGAIRLKWVSRNWVKIREASSAILDRFFKEYPSESSVLVRYCRALDSSDNQASLLKLWSLLESLTGTVGQSYDRTILIAAGVYRDEDRFEHGLLECLRGLRNRVVHHDQGTSSQRWYTMLLQRYVSALVEMLINSKGTFASFQHLAEFLALPRGEEDLRRKLRLYEAALRFREYDSSGENS